MRRIVTRTFIAFSALALMAAGLTLAGCGGSGGGGAMSSQVLSGNASVGAPLSGQVSLKDSSSPPLQKTAVIGSDGSFAFDVTSLKAPYILQGSGNSAGTAYKLHSFADGAGIANVNPLSNVVVASAAGVKDPEQVYAAPDQATIQKIKSGLPDATRDILSQLQPLLKLYSADGKDPIKDHYDADHQGLDGLFDNVTITIPNGIVTVTNTKTGAVIFTAAVTDIKNGQFSPDPNSLPQPPAVPVAPGGVSAVGATGQVALSWNAVSNATSYNVYYAATSGVTTAGGTKIPNVTSPYVQAGLAAGTTCYYIVTAVNSAGESSASAQVSAVTAAAPAVPTVPSSPSGVIATGGTRQVTLSWSTVSSATSYNVYYSTTPGVTKANGTKLANASTPAVQSGLADATTYYYIVTAVNSTGEGAASVQVAAATLSATPTPTAPATPTALTAAGGANQVNLSWAGAAGASSYNVYWSATAGVTTANGTKVAGITSPYVKTALSSGTAYYFIVTAANSTGESAASAQAQATTNAAPAAVPPAPTGVAATGGANQVSLSWAAVPGATTYNVYWSTASGVTTASGTRISVAGSPYLQTGLAAGTTYYYIVTAVNSAGESPASTRVTAATSAPVSKQLTLAWDPDAGATSYNLYWSTIPGVTPASGIKISGVSSPYVHTGLAAGTTYYYVVTAANSSTESAASAPASGTTPL